MNKKIWFLLTLIISFTLVLAACGDKENNAKPENNDAGTEDNGNNESNGNDSDAEGNNDGTLTYAVDNAPEELYMPGFYSSATDAQIVEFIHENLITVDENLDYQPHIADWETEDNKVYTFTIQEGIKWHNGEELTMEDWQFALEVIGHPDYEEDRYNYVAEI